MKMRKDNGGVHVNGIYLPMGSPVGGVEILWEVAVAISLAQYAEDQSQKQLTPPPSGGCGCQPAMGGVV